MKLFRFGALGEESPGVVDFSGVARDASALGMDFGEAFFEAGGLERLRSLLDKGVSDWPVVDLKKVRLGAPVTRPSKLLAIGLNYKEHASETGSKLPVDPKIFMKATTSICGVSDELILPRGSTHTDYEVELAVVISKRASYVTEEQALDYVAGYTICNDYSERDFQKNRAGQFVKGKSADSFGPLGPFLITADEGHFEASHIWCKVNGEMRQDASTSDMLFKVPKLISSLSSYMTLLPGDVISTGTPSGVGMGHVPPVYLKAGDLVEYGIAGIGEGRQLVRAFQGPSGV